MSEPKVKKALLVLSQNKVAILKCHLYEKDSKIQQAVQTLFKFSCEQATDNFAAQLGYTENADDYIFALDEDRETLRKRVRKIMRKL